MKPLVTIGIPVFNEVGHVLETIESAINQSFENIEILISDNGSTDGSTKIIQKIALSDSRIKVFEHKRNNGPVFNFKCLLDNAKCNYFIWLGAHDLMQPDYIENAFNILDNNDDVVAVYPKVYPIENGIVKKELINPNYVVSPDTLSERILKIIQTTTRGSAIHSVYRTEILKKCFKDINGGDLMIILTAASYGKLLPSPNIALYMRNVRPNEESKEQKARYKEFGFSNNWETIRYMYPFELVSNLKKMKLKNRVSLLSKVRRSMRVYRNVHWKEIFLFHLKDSKYKTAFFVFYTWTKEKIAPHE